MLLDEGMELETLWAMNLLMKDRLHLAHLSVHLLHIRHLTDSLKNKKITLTEWKAYIS